MAVPAGRSAPRRRRSGDAEPHQRPEHGGQRRGAARRCAGCRAAVPALCRGTDRIGRRSCLVRGGGSRTYRLHDAGDAPAAAASRRDELLRMTRAMARTLRWIAATPGAEIARALADFFPSVAPDIFAAAIDRYRALDLFAADPVHATRGLRPAAGGDALRRGARSRHPVRAMRRQFAGRAGPCR